MLAVVHTSVPSRADAVSPSTIRQLSRGVSWVSPPLPEILRAAAAAAAIGPDFFDAAGGGVTTETRESGCGQQYRVQRSHRSRRLAAARWRRT